LPGRNHEILEVRTASLKHDRRSDRSRPPFTVFTDCPDFAITEKRLSKRVSSKQSSYSVARQKLAENDGVLLFFMKTERQRGFCPFLPRNIVTRRRRRFRKMPWRKGICGQKESRLDIGCVSIGSGRSKNLKQGVRER